MPPARTSVVKGDEHEVNPPASTSHSIILESPVVNSNAGVVSAVTVPSTAGLVMYTAGALASIAGEESAAGAVVKVALKLAAASLSETLTEIWSESARSVFPLATVYTAVYTPPPALVNPLTATPLTVIALAVCPTASALIVRVIVSPILSVPVVGEYETLDITGTVVSMTILFANGTVWSQMF